MFPGYCSYSNTEHAAAQITLLPLTLPSSTVRTEMRHFPSRTVCRQYALSHYFSRDRLLLLSRPAAAAFTARLTRPRSWTALSTCRDERSRPPTLLRSVDRTQASERSPAIKIPLFAANDFHGFCADTWTIIPVSEATTRIGPTNHSSTANLKQDDLIQAGPPCPKYRATLHPDDAAVSLAPSRPRATQG